MRSRRPWRPCMNSKRRIMLAISPQSVLYGSHFKAILSAFRDSFVLCAELPLSAIILLSVLGSCLIIFAIVYKFINFDTCCSGGSKDKDKDKTIDKSHYAELGQVIDQTVSTWNTEEDKLRKNSRPKSVVASNPAFDDTDFMARGQPKAKSATSLFKTQQPRRDSATSLHKIQLPRQPRRPSEIPTTPPRRSDRLSMPALENISNRFICYLSKPYQTPESY
ncbi:hypothetical protein QZH41_003487 [Actinostola sp. cb2023]|nr:hypothetical protein QZH41_003487 [Actinostola sp. cb2023]